MLKSHIYPYCIDSHLHLQFLQEKEPQIEEFYTTLFAKNLCYALDIGVHEDDLTARRTFEKLYQGQLLLSSGIHPLYCGDGDIEKRLLSLEENLKQGGLVALGECGLDFFRSQGEEAARQYPFFHGQLQLAELYQLPLLIHSRDAASELEKVLSQYNLPAGVVLHCFSAHERLLSIALERGFFVSFAGNVTYKNAHELRRLAGLIPLENLLIETDAPFLSPEPHRGKMNHSGHLGYILETLASLHDIEVEALSQQIYKNFCSLFQLEQAQSKP